MHQRKRAFTLVELLVVISIIGMLAALILPAITAARERARQLQCSNNLVQLGKATVAYASSKDKYPGRINGVKSVRSTNDEWYSTFAVLLPYVEQKEMWDRMLATSNYNAALGIANYGNLNVLLCPNDVARESMEYYSSFVVNSGFWDGQVNGKPSDFQANGVFHTLVPLNNTLSVPPIINGAISDGASQTILFSENLQSGAPVESNPNGYKNNGWILSLSEAGDGMVWVNSFPLDNTIQKRINENRDFSPNLNNPSELYARPSSHHINGVNICFADASARFMSQDIDYFVYQSLLTSKGRDVKLPPDGTPAINDFYKYFYKDSDFK